MRSRSRPLLRAATVAAGSTRYSVRRAMPLLLCVSLCGCFHFRSQEYPPGWPALHTGQGDCSSIAGTYADSGERIGDNSFEFDSLSSALGQYKALVVAAPTDRVAISFGEDGTMVVKVWAKKAVVGAMQFSHDGGEFQCRWGEIEISRSRFSAAEQV